MAPLFAQREIPPALRRDLGAELIMGRKAFGQLWKGRTPLYPPDLWPATFCSTCQEPVDYFYVASQDDWYARCTSCDLRRPTGAKDCVYCLSSSATQREHIIPEMMGGQVVVPSCGRCNREKLNQMPVLEWPVPDRLLWVIAQDVKRIRHFLLDVANQADADPNYGVTQAAKDAIQNDIAWWEVYLRFIERR